MTASLSLQIPSISRGVVSHLVKDSQGTNTIQGFMHQLRESSEQMQRAVGKVLQGRIVPKRYHNAEETTLVSIVRSTAVNIAEVDSFLLALQDEFLEDTIQKGLLEIADWTLYANGHFSLNERVKNQIINKCRSLSYIPTFTEAERALFSPLALSSTHGDFRYFSEMTNAVKQIHQWNKLSGQLKDYWGNDPLLSVSEFTTHESLLLPRKEALLKLHIKFQMEFQETYEHLIQKRALLENRRSLRMEQDFLQQMVSYSHEEILDLLEVLDRSSPAAKYLLALETLSKELLTDLPSLIKERLTEISATLDKLNGRIEELNTLITKNSEWIEMMQPEIELQLLELQAKDLMDEVHSIRAINDTDLKEKFNDLFQGLFLVDRFIALASQQQSDVEMLSCWNELAEVSEQLAGAIKASWQTFHEGCKKADEDERTELHQAFMDSLRAIRRKVLQMTHEKEDLQEALHFAMLMAREMKEVVLINPHIKLLPPHECGAFFREHFTNVPSSLSYFEDHIHSKETPKMEHHYGPYDAVPKDGPIQIAIKEENGEIYILEGRKIPQAQWNRALCHFQEQSDTQRTYFSGHPETVYLKWDDRNHKVNASSSFFANITIQRFSPKLLKPNDENSEYIQRLRTAISLKKALRALAQRNMGDLVFENLQALTHTVQAGTISDGDPLQHFAHVFSQGYVLFSKFNSHSESLVKPPLSLQPSNVHLKEASQLAKRFVEWQKVVQNALERGRNSRVVKESFGQFIKELESLQEGMNELVGSIPRELLSQDYLQELRRIAIENGQSKINQMLAGFYQAVSDFSKRSEASFASLTLPSFLPQLARDCDMRLSGDSEFQALLRTITGRFFKEMSGLGDVLHKQIQQGTVNASFLDLMDHYRQIRSWEENVRKVCSETLHILKTQAGFNLPSLIRSFFTRYAE